ALHHCIPRGRQGTMGAQHPRYEGPLLPVPHARWMDDCVPSPRQAHNRDRCADLRHYRTGMERHAPGRCQRIQVPTNIVWILGRIYCTGTPEDYKAVHEVQDQCKLVPLSAYGKPYTPPEGKVDPSIEMKMAVRDQVNRMDAKEYFTLLAQ